MNWAAFNIIARTTPAMSYAQSVHKIGDGCREYTGNIVFTCTHHKISIEHLYEIEVQLKSTYASLQYIVSEHWKLDNMVCTRESCRLFFHRSRSTIHEIYLQRDVKQLNVERPWHTKVGYTDPPHGCPAAAFWSQIERQSRALSAAWTSTQCQWWNL